MSASLHRLGWGLVMVPTAAVLGFLIGGHLAAWIADSGSALAGSASVALVGVAFAILAVGVAAWVARRQAIKHLPRTVMLLLLVTALTVWATVAGAFRG